MSSSTLNGIEPLNPQKVKAKDHDNHPFHTIAAALAKEAVRKKVNPWWHVGIKEVRDKIKKLSEQSKNTWNFINENYETMFGTPNQVKK